MQFGVCLPNYGDTLDIEGLKKLALLAEELGFDSIWLTDHILMPKRSGTPYENILESITTMAYLASLTKKVKLGISSLIIALRNPIIVAKQIATIDLLSNGRAMLAIGAGWNEKEFSFLGADFHKRGKIVNESIKLMRSLWSNQPSFKGKYIKQYYEDASFSPPLKRNIPIWIAGNSVYAMKRAIKYGDAWHPNVLVLESFRKAVENYKSLASEVKPIRPRIAFDITSSSNIYVSPLGEKRVLLSRNMDENKKTIEELESLGVDYLLITTNPRGNLSIQDQQEALNIFASKFL